MSEQKGTEKEEQEEASSSSPTNRIQEIIRRGNEIYEALKEGLEVSNTGKYIVIEVDSGKYFVGDTRDEATSKARTAFPDTIMFIRKIGQVEKASRHFCSSDRYYNYARLL